MLRARGRLIGFMDCGGDIDPEGWLEALRVQAAEDADVVAGSKRHPDSQVEYPPLRRAYSLTYQLLTRVLFRPGIRDTQTGLKLFKAEVVQAVAPLLFVKRFAFDVELLVVESNRGFRVMREVPVRVRYGSASTIGLASAWNVLLDTLATFYRVHLARSYSRLDSATKLERRLLHSPAMRLAGSDCHRRTVQGRRR
jgi:hypothetical protein